jgi:hypothetical protein
MSYWAEIDDNNRVLQVLVGDSDLEDRGESFFADVVGGNWVETSVTGEFRAHYAGIGFTYDATRDAFIPPQPFPSWVLDEDTCLWVAPIAYPAEGVHTWDEQAGDWVEVTDETV